MFVADRLACVAFAIIAGLALGGVAKAQPVERPPEFAMSANAGRGKLLYLPVRIDGGPEVPFLVDTGSSRTMIARELRDSLGKQVASVFIQSWGQTNLVPVYKAPKLTLGNVPLLTGGTVGTWDFKNLVTPEGRRVMGMLSIDCLKNYCLQLDFEANRVRFLSSDEVKSASLGKAFPIFFQNRPFIHHVALIPGASTNCLLDTGFDADGRVEPQETGYSQGRLSVAECRWDGNIYTNLVVGQETNANLLGLRFFARHLATFDFPNHTLYLLRRSEGPLVPENSGQK